jgi:hypothetical protein
MNKFLSSIAIFAFSACTYAGGAFTIINNTDTQLNVDFGFCKHKLCTHTYNQQLQAKGSDNNFVSMMFPAGMNNIVISSANAYDSNNNVVASLASNCKASLNHDSILVLDSYGTNKIYCMVQ